MDNCSTGIVPKSGTFVLLDEIDKKVIILAERLQCVLQSGLDCAEEKSQQSTELAKRLNYISENLSDLLKRIDL